MFIALVLLICWPIAELYVAIRVAEAIGVLDTFVLLIAGIPIGIWAVRSQGRAVRRRLADTIAAGRTPTRELLDGALIVVGGGLLIVPGFITDVLGITLLLPPTRALTRGLLVAFLRTRLVAQAVRVTRRREPYDVDSTARDVEEPRLRP